MSGGGGGQAAKRPRQDGAHEPAAATAAAEAVLGTEFKNRDTNTWEPIHVQQFIYHTLGSFDGDEFNSITSLPELIDAIDDRKLGSGIGKEDCEKLKNCALDIIDFEFSFSSSRCHSNQELLDVLSRPSVSKVRQLTSVPLISEPDRTWAVKAIVLHCPQLRGISLGYNGCEFSDASAVFFAKNCPRLEVMLCRRPLSDETYSVLAESCPLLRKVSFGWFSYNALRKLIYNCRLLNHICLGNFRGDREEVLKLLHELPDGMKPTSGFQVCPGKLGYPQSNPWGILVKNAGCCTGPYL